VALSRSSAAGGLLPAAPSDELRGRRDADRSAAAAAAVERSSGGEGGASSLDLVRVPRSGDQYEPKLAPVRAPRGGDPNGSIGAAGEAWCSPVLEPSTFEANI
jgi:hypothetical protein